MKIKVEMRYTSCRIRDIPQYGLYSAGNMLFMVLWEQIEDSNTAKVLNINSGKVSYQNRDICIAPVEEIVAYYAP